MSTHVSTTPFGRRTLTRAQIVGQAAARSRNPDNAVHKWAVFRDICAARPRLCVSERALAVLDALLSFHPETALTGSDLVVFPSNQQLSLRAHGMAPATLRRHLAVLVEAGLIARRDSPNGKRYARKDARGGIEVAYGFDLSPLVVRAPQFAAWADEVRAEARAAKQLRERITITRRDIAKMIAHGQEQGIPLPPSQAPACDWDALHTHFRRIVARIPRTATSQTLTPIADELGAFAHKLAIILEQHAQSACLSTNESHSERHKQNSDSDSLFESERACGTTAPNSSITPHTPTVTGHQDPSSGPAREHRNISALNSHTACSVGASLTPCRDNPTIRALSPRMPDGNRSTVAAQPDRERGQSLSLVRALCPEVSQYARHGLATWGDLIGAVTLVRPFLGISPSAWDTARHAMGEIDAAIVVACILERAGAIANPGGYLRNLAARAMSGTFSVRPMLAALIKGQSRDGDQQQSVTSGNSTRHQNFFRNADYIERADRV